MGPRLTPSAPKSSGRSQLGVEGRGEGGRMAVGRAASARRPPGDRLPPTRRPPPTNTFCYEARGPMHTKLCRCAPASKVSAGDTGTPATPARNHLLPSQMALAYVNFARCRGAARQRSNEPVRPFCRGTRLCPLATSTAASAPSQDSPGTSTAPPTTGPTGCCASDTGGCPTNAAPLTTTCFQQTKKSTKLAPSPQADHCQCGFGGGGGGDGVVGEADPSCARLPW